jgi:trans-aconitate methyltransferase
VTGIDAATRLVDHAAQTLPDGEWVVDDMRSVDLGRTFEGLLIWPSLFHLTPGDQSRAIERILAHSSASSILMMTIPAEASVSIRAWSGEPLFHASLGATLYMDTLAKAGFTQVQLDSGTTSERASAWMFRRRSVKPTS